MAHLNSAPPEQSIRRPRRRLAARLSRHNLRAFRSPQRRPPQGRAFLFYQNGKQTTYPLALEPKYTIHHQLRKARVVL